MFKKLSFLIFFSALSFCRAQKTDSLQIELPAKYKLKLADSKQNTQMKMLEYIPEHENWENYSIIVTKLIMKNAVNVPLETVYEGHKKMTLDKAKGVTINEISRNKPGEREYVLFTVETEEFPDSETTESQVYYFVKGDKDIIMAISAIKAKKLPQEFIDEWSNIFLKSRIIK